MKTATAVVSLVVLVSLVLGAAPARAEWINRTTEVPVERLVGNLDKRVKANPDDARAHYVLGRIHSMAYARGATKLSLHAPAEGEKQALPGFAPWDTVREVGSKTPLTPERQEHYRRCIQHYSRSVALDPKSALTWLGLAWMLEDGSVFASEMGTPDGGVVSPVPAEDRLRYEELVRQLGASRSADRVAATDALRAALPHSTAALVAARQSKVPDVRIRVGRLLRYEWERRAITAYRRAFDLALEPDGQLESLPMEGDGAVSLEAGLRLVRLLEKLPDAPDTKAEIVRIEAAIEKLGNKPRWITPVIFPVDGEASLSSLLAGGGTVRFDLDGDGEADRWPWPGPGAGILVWDPEGRGKIESGRRLFGSVTWWMPWRNGYEPLAALDDDGDGALRGEELRGIAVWRDANADGRSDPGEVVPARDLGIDSISTRPTGRREGVPAHRAGIRMADGSTRPTYDWTPERRVP